VAARDRIGQVEVRLAASGSVTEARLLGRTAGNRLNAPIVEIRLSLPNRRSPLRS
jgi:hypothetical protein